MLPSRSIVAGLLLAVVLGLAVPAVRGAPVALPLVSLLLPLGWLAVQWQGWRALLPALLISSGAHALTGASPAAVGVGALATAAILILSLWGGRQAWPSLWGPLDQGIRFVLSSLLLPWGAGALVLLLLVPGDPAQLGITWSLLGLVSVGLALLTILSPLAHALGLARLPAGHTAPPLALEVAPPQRTLETVLALAGLLVAALVLPPDVRNLCWGLLLGGMALRAGMRCASGLSGIIALLLLLLQPERPPSLLETVGWAAVGLLGVAAGRVALLWRQAQATHQQLARRLLVAEERLHAISVGLPDLTFLVDGADRTVEIIARQPELLLRPADQLRGHDLASILPEALREPVRERLRQARCRAEPPPLEYPLVLPDGSKRWFESRFLVAGPLAGLGEALLIVARDITRERQQRRWHEQHSRLEALGRLAGGVAHDLNNALQMIFFSASFVREGLAEDAPQQADVQDLLEAATRAQEVTRHLLTFSQHDVPTPPPIDLGAVLSATVDWYRRTLPALTIHLEIEPPLGAVPIDPGSAERILGNLIANARDAMGGQGTIQIRLSSTTVSATDPMSPGLPPGAYVCLEVRDQGPGLTAADLEHLFEPFYTTKSAEKGSGLGLATVYALVSRCRGHIQPHNHPDGGACFTLHLPRAREVAAPPRGAQPLLFVEDDESARRPLVRALLAQGYRVDVAASGPEALALFEADPERYSAVITDLIMPDMSGAELLAILHARRPTLPALVITGYADVALPHPVRILYKPFESAVLLAALEDLLQSPTP